MRISDWSSDVCSSDLPGDLQPWFGDLLIADVLDAPRDFRFRLFGTNIANAVGRDLTGRRLSDPDTLDDPAPALLKVLSEVVDGPTIATTAGGLYWQQRSYLRFPGLSLPLCAEGELGRPSCRAKVCK